MTALKAAVAALRPLEVPGRLRIGVSPHAPYTVSGPLYHEVGKWAREERLPLAVHLAESAEESSLLLDGTRWVRRRLVEARHPGPGAARPESGRLCRAPHGPRRYALHPRRAGRRRRHRPPLPPGRIGRALSVVQPRAPAWRRTARGDPRGEDPRGGGDRLSAERGRARPSRVPRARRGPSPASMPSTRWGWSGGMRPRAIGFWDKLGMLVVGGQADVAVSEHAARHAQPEEELLSGRGAVLATFVGGREVYRRGNG